MCSAHSAMSKVQESSPLTDTGLVFLCNCCCLAYRILVFNKQNVVYQSSQNHCWFTGWKRQKYVPRPVVTTSPNFQKVLFSEQKYSTIPLWKPTFPVFHNFVKEPNWTTNKVALSLVYSCTQFICCCVCKINLFFILWRSNWVPSAVFFGSSPLCSWLLWSVLFSKFACCNKKHFVDIFELNSN